MKKSNIILAVLILSMISLIFSGCGGGGTTPPINHSPTITSLTANPQSPIEIDQSTVITCSASDPDDEPLTYTWSKTGGTFEGSTTGSSITWRAPSTEGNHTVECEVSDGEASDSKSVNISVDGSTGSTVSSIEVFPETMNIGVGNSQSIELITAHYDNGSTADIALNACTYSSSNTGVATVDIGVITAIALGSATITVVYTEGYTEGDITKTDALAVTVSADVNHAPVITSTAVTSATKDEPYSYYVNATDSDGDTLVYSLTTKPGGMSINSSTGLIAWTPTTSGDYNVTVKVSDGEFFDTQSFTVIVEESGTTTRIIRLEGDLSFGSVNVGSTSQRTLTIYNDGNSTLTVSSISYPTGFS
ncbi:Ig domain-containing protein, partial [bacterium]|nr:Ig domain-containing protein [bacterium]